jgi:serine/threonine-protein kinase
MSSGLVLRPSPRVGDVIGGRWRIDAALGAGAHARVYAATSLSDGRRVALKILRAEMANGPMLARFRREGFIANAVGHPGVVSINDLGETDDGAQYIVMELCDGESLESIRARGPMPPSEVVRVGIAVLEVLAAAHARGIVHRDIKPANVFITSTSDVKVLDFGVARLLDTLGSTGVTRHGAIIGTLAFMPPEQASGAQAQVDARSDLWALGATLFTLLSGRAVHAAGTHHTLLLAALTSAAPPLRTVAPHVPEELAAIVDRALAHAREDRWPDATSMADALRAARGAVESAAPPADRAATDRASPAETAHRASGLPPFVHGALAACVSAMIVLAALIAARGLASPGPAATDTSQSGTPAASNR